MECFSILAILVLLGLALWVGSLRNQVERLEARMAELEKRSWEARTAGTARAAEPAAAPAPVEAPAEAPRPAEPAWETVSFPAAPPPVAAPPPPLPIAPPPPPSPPAPAPPAPRAASRKPFDWEGLIGVKLFSWIAGVLLVLAAIQFLRYSIEHGWLSPPVRMAFGFATGVALLVVCELRVARRYAVTANAMDAAGIAILFATTFASYSLWGILGAVPAFALMALITAAAVWLSLRRDSVFIALLGLIGGFLTPALLSTGQDRPLSLFGYLLLLNAGLAWVALRRSWPLLSLLSLIFTTMYQWAWVARFLDAEEPLAVMIFLAFPLLTFVLPLVARRDGPGEAGSSFEWTAAVGAALPLLFAVYFAAVPGYGKHYGLLFGFLLLLDAGLAVIAARKGPEVLHPVAAGITFLVTAVWLGTSYSVEAWPAILGLVAALVLFYLAAPLVLRRFGGKLDGEGRLAVFAAPLLLAAFPVLAVRPPAAAEVSFGVMVLLAATIAGIAGFGLLERDSRPTVLAFGVAGLGLLIWAFTLREGGRPASGVWIAVALAAVAGLALLASSRREGAGEGEGRALAAGYAWAALASLLLGQLALTVLGTAPGAPGLGLLLPVHLGFLAALLALAAAWRWTWPGPVSVGLTALAVLAWRFGQGSLVSPWQQLLFAAGIYTVYLIYPLALGERARRLREPFLTAVLASVPFFLFAREALMRAGQDRFSGLLALVQAAALSLLLLQLVRFLRSEPAAERGTARDRGRLALMSGAVLAFLTAAIPLQFEREWITLGWALLAAALAWLHLRLEHRPLLYWTAGLLAASFVRLAFNPAVLEYHPRTGVAVWNVYLYIYLVPAAAFFLAAVFLRRSREDDRLLPAPFPALSSLAYGGGTALLFLLLNVEIADFFSRDDSLTFAFLTGQATLAEDLAYTLGWALFGIGLLVAGLTFRARPARIAAIVLLLCAVLKGFLHDLAQLGGLYRVASFVGLAAALALVAVLIQKFVLASRDEPAP
jgi:hypothetical protein